MKLIRRISFIALFVMSVAACTMPKVPTGTALVYGISIYQTAYPEGDHRSNNLTYTDDDAEAVARLLTAQGWIVKERIANTQIPEENMDTTRLAIETDIAALQDTQDLVLFYYSGHGTYNYSGESQIIPFGAIENTSDRITSNELYAMFESAGLSDVIVLLDSCNSGGFVNSGATVDATPPVFGRLDNEADLSYTWFVDALGEAAKGYLSYTGNSRFVIVSAAGAGELSWESDFYGHGIFTWFLLKSATDPLADMDSNGLVTSSELFAYCATNINSTWNAENYSLYDSYSKTYADYIPHISGTPREYALWATQ